MTRSPPHRNELFGFGVAHGSYPVDYHASENRAVSAWVPYWALMLASAALPLRHWARYRHSHRERTRSRAGLCPRCGYDLPASTGRCPECGLAVSVTSTG